MQVGKEREGRGAELEYFILCLYYAVSCRLYQNSHRSSNTIDLLSEPNNIIYDCHDIFYIIEKGTEINTKN